MFPIQFEDLYRQIVETAYEGIWVLDAEMRTRFVNERMAQMLGYTVQEMSAASWLDFLLSEDKTAALKKLEQQKKGCGEKFEVRYRRRDGSSLRARVSANPLFDEAGKYIGAIVINTDVTENKTAKNGSRENENLLHLIANGIPALIAYVDREHCYRFVNESYTDWFGIEPAEVKGRHVREVLGETIYQAVLPEMRRALEGEKLTFERHLTYRDGRTRFVQINYIPDFDGEKVRGFFALILDISERKMVEENLLNSEERYRAFVSRSTEAIWRFEMEEPISVDLSPDEQIEGFYKFGFLAECNDAMARMYGFVSAEEIVGTRLGAFLPREDAGNIAYLKAFITSGYRLENAESHELDRDGNPKFFLNNLVGIIENNFLSRAWGTQRDITESKRAELALQQSEERYRIVAETASDAIISIDQESRIVFVNAAAERIFGYKVEEMIGQSLAMLIPVAMRESHLAGMSRYLKTGERKLSWNRMEVSGRHSDGHVFPLEISFDEYNQNGKRFFIGIARDVSVRRKIEKTTAHLAAIVESSDDAIISKDLDGIVTSWNKSAEKMFGFTAAEAVGKPITIIIPSYLTGEEDLILSRIRNGERIENYETVRQRKDGSFIDISITISPIQDGSGKIIGISKIARDISEKKAAQEISERYRLLWMRARDIILFIRPGGRIAEANHAAVSAYGYDYETLLRMRIHDLRAPETRAMVDWQYEQADKSGIQFETIHQRRDGSRFPVEVSSIGADVGDERFIVSIIRDITERKRTQEILDENRVMLSLAMRSSRMGVWERDIATGAVNWSEELEEIFGLEKGSFGGREIDFFELLHEDDRTEAWAEVEKAIDEHRDYTIEFRFYHADGSVRWMEGRGQAVYSEKGEPVRLYGIGIDITDRKRAQESIVEGARQKEALYRLADQLHRAKSSDDVYEASLDAIINALQCDRASILLFDDTGVMRFVSWRGLPDSYRKTAEGHSPWQRDEKNPKPVYISDIDATDIDDSLKAVIKAEGISALGFIPLVSDGKLIGKFMAYFNTPHLFSDGELELGLTIARQLAFAIARQRAEKDLLEAEERFRLLTENAKDYAMVFFDTRGRITHWNFGAERILGWSESEIIGQPVEIIFTPEDRENKVPEKELETAAATGHAQNEQWHLRKDGSRFFAFGEIIALYDEAGNLRGFAKMFRDLTESKQAEELLRKSEAEFRLLANAVPQIVWVAAADGTIEYVNEQWTEFSGLTLEETAKPENIAALLHPDDREAVFKEWERAFTRGILFEIEARIKEHSTGEYRWFLMRSEPTRDADGAVVQWFGTSTDITANKENELRMRESEERFSKAFSASPLILTISSLETGKLIEVNETFVRATGYSREEALGKTTLELGLWKKPQERAEEMEMVRRAGKLTDLEYTFRTRTGEEIVGLLSAERIEIGGEPFALTVIQDITGRKEAERKIRESESTLRAYYNSSPLMMGIVQLLNDEDDILHIYDNPATCAFFGIEAELTAGRRASEIGASAEVIGLWLEHYRKSEKLNSPVTFEYEQLVGEEMRWLSVTVSCIGAGGGCSRFAYVAEDTTERKRSDEQIRYQLNLTQTITDNTQSCLLMMDSEGRGTFANTATERVTGFKPEELIGELLHEKLHHKYPDGTPFPIEECPLYNTLQREESVVGYEDVFVHRDGYFYPIRCNARPIYKEGEPIATVIEIQDITEEKRAREALLGAERKAADEYQALLQRIVPLGQTLGTARDLSSIYRAVHEFICSSMSCSAFFVSSYNESSRLRLPEYVWGEGVEVDVSKLPPMPLTPEGGANSQAVFQKKTIITNNYWESQKNRPHVVLEDDGKEPQTSLVVPMIIKNDVVGTLEVQSYENEAFSQEHAVALEMVANLAAVAIENVRLLEVEASARQAAEAANRAKDEFLSVLSHELRTPLNSMLGWVRMLKSGMLDEEKSNKAVEVIERNALLQNNLIEDLLDVSRIISGKMRIEKENIELVKVFTDAVDILRPVAALKNLAFEFRTPENSLMIEGDAMRLQQIVSNLVQNAVKFTPEGGTVSVSLKRDGNFAALVVKDNGIGIREEILPYIFERFRQADSSTKRVYSGLGLGLTIVRNLVTLHGGTISVQSAGENQGTTITVKIPLSEEFLLKTSTGKTAGSVVETQASLNGARILLVDDDLESLVPLQIFLEKENAEIVLATSAKEALEKLAAQNFHVLITDIGMPVIDGYDLIAKVRQLQTEQNAFITAIALTAYASTEDRRRALSAGFQHHFAKPIDYDQLLKTISDIYATSSNN